MNKPLVYNTDLKAGTADSAIVRTPAFVLTVQQMPHDTEIRYEISLVETDQGRIVDVSGRGGGDENPALRREIKLEVRFDPIEEDEEA